MIQDRYKRFVAYIIIYIPISDLTTRLNFVLNRDIDIYAIEIIPNKI